MGEREAKGRKLIYNSNTLALYRNSTTLMSLSRFLYLMLPSSSAQPSVREEETNHRQIHVASDLKQYISRQLLHCSSSYTDTT